MRKRLKNHFIPHEGNEYKPHFVHERHIAGLALLVIAIFGLAFSVKSLVLKNPDLLSAVITGVLVDLTNSTRLSQNLGALEADPVLAAAAQLKANDMAEKSYFAHTSPEGRSPWHWFREGGYDFLYAGENLAVNFSDSEDVVRAWMNSEGHKANILNDKFTEIGIAIAPGTYQGRSTIYVVQLFGQPAPETVRSASVTVVAETNPAKTPETPTQNATGNVAAVEAEQVEVETFKVIAEDKMFIAVENTNATEEISEPYDRELVAQASAVDRVVTAPKMALKVIYMAIGAVALIVLILFVTIRPKKEHSRHVVYVILFLVLISVLIYLTNVFLFPKTLVE